MALSAVTVDVTQLEEKIQLKNLKRLVMGIDRKHGDKFVFISDASGSLDQVKVEVLRMHCASCHEKASAMTILDSIFSNCDELL